MKNKSLLGWLEGVFLASLFSLSLGLIGYGLFYDGGLACFGLVLSMTAVLLSVCYAIGPTPNTELRKKPEEVQISQVA